MPAPVVHDGRTMSTAFDTAAIVRALEAAHMDRRQAEAVAAACHEAATAAQPVTPDLLDAALATLETRMTWRLLGFMAALLAVHGGMIVAAVAMIP